jgi:Ca-activated chloride channel homolog
MQANFSLDYDVVTLEHPQKLYLMARFTSGPAPQDASRRPLNLSLIIDRSGSMAGDKIDYTRQAAQFLVQNLSISDMLSIILYNDKVETLLMPEKVQRKDVISQKIAGIKAGGTTNLSGGWLEGCTLVAKNLNDDCVNRTILMSDGLANRGVTDSQQLIKLAQQKYEDGISTTTMGLGTDFNEDLLMDMANAGGGAYYFIESPESAPVIFHEELQGLLNVVGQNLTISIEPISDVTAVAQLNSYPMTTEGKVTSFRLGDVFGEEVKALMLELAIPALTDIGERQIAILRFEYDKLTLEGTEHNVREFPVMVNVKTDDGQAVLVDPEVQKSVLLLKSAQARKQAIQMADKGNFDLASQKLRGAAKEIEDSKVDDPILLEDKDALLQQAERIEKGKEGYNFYERKSMSSQAFYTSTSRHGETIALRGREQKRQTQSMKSIVPEDVKIEKQIGTVPTHATWRDKTFKLEGSLIRVGRSNHNEIIIAVKGVSRFHCQMVREDSKLLLQDLGSTNGTIISSVILTNSHELSVGDVAYICDEKLIFHDGTFKNLE